MTRMRVRKVHKGPEVKSSNSHHPRFIIAQVQDDFYGNVGTYMAGPIRKRIVDNKNRVLLLKRVRVID